MRLSGAAVHYISVIFIGLLNVRILGKSIRISRSVLPALKVDPLEYLEQYGYLDKRLGRSEHTAQEVTLSIEKLQKFMNLPVTGTIDEDTIKLLNTRRCPLPDFRNNSNDTLARYANSGRRWPSNYVGWKVNKVEGSNFGRSELENLVARAVQEWARPSLLQFQQSGSILTEIVVDFVVPDAQGNHGDGANFNSNDLGHAFYPGFTSLDGDCHMNMNQQFYTSSYNPFASDMFFVLVHELGHSLGLDHSGVSAAVMYPTLSRGTTYRGLHGDDINGIIAIYGRSRFYSGVSHVLSSLCLILLGLLSSFIFIE